MGRIRRGKDEPVIIKKYANRRLYDTGKSSYVTLEDLYEMVKDDMEFVVQDAKTGEDITNSVLNQIISEREQTGEQLLPNGFMRKLIGLYGNSMQGFVPNYLENAMDIFVTNQERLREQMTKSLQGMQGMNPMKGMFPGAPALEEMNRKNIAMFERTMKMFTPPGFKNPYSVNGSHSEEHPKKDEKKREERIQDLKRNIAEMERELTRLSS
ncbi:MAG: polyhydroxyalkanoate synthesis repressor PhaR [Alphaproteobacteria bacterium]|nr:polyhydroxyalkanoate synthesis repressor PhaR [Alphaproteobacteria bacterium]